MFTLRHPLAACAALALALLAPAPSLAAPARSAATPVGHITAMILDMSGSMATNDPQGLRCSAANAYIDLSGSNPNDPTNYVGIIGLDNNNATGPSGGAHGFRLASIWAQPTATDTLASRQQLRQTIATDSNNCQPDGNTPTYDALVKAYAMLDAATQGNTLSASVILLTDGNPDPQGDAQVADIKSELTPKFTARAWPIDTIALGTDTSYRGFLSGLSAATGGVAYDDSQGPVAGVSPLNLERAFVDIFLEYEGRRLKSTIPPTKVAGTATAQFSIGDAVTHLDVIVVKDTPATTITLTDPNGQVFQPDQQGNFISTDPHYVIFALEAHPPAPALQNGPWTLNVSGQGMFLMDSLVVSPLALNITAPTAGKTLPLGQPVTLAATITDEGNIVIDKTFDVQAIVTAPGQTTGLQVYMKDRDATGTYSGTFSLPLSAPVGNYTIHATATLGTIAAADDTGVTFALFPTPALLGAQGQPLVPAVPAGCQTGDASAACQPVSAPATAQVVAWDGVIRWLYTQVPVFDATVGGHGLRDWPLAGYALNPQAPAPGEVIIGAGANLKVYAGATVTATATDAHGHDVPVTVRDLGHGHFAVVFPSGAQGTYTVQLLAAGNPADTFGAPVTVTAPVRVSIGAPARNAELRAWAVTVLYLLVALAILIFGVYGPINYLLRPKPTGRARLVDTGVAAGGAGTPVLPLRWRGASLRRYFTPNVLPSGQASLPNNLFFVFGYGRAASVRLRPTRGKAPAAVWRLNGRVLTVADGREALTTDMVLTLDEAGQQRDYRFEQISRRGAKLAAQALKPKKAAKAPKPPKAPKAPKPPKAVKPPAPAKTPVGATP